jgi:hypothetical protein
LIVEDEPRVAEVIADALRQLTMNREWPGQREMR